MQNKNTIEALKVELSTLRTLLAGAIEEANKIDSILNEMTEENETPDKEKMLDFVSDFVEENSGEIQDDLEENVFEIELDTREYHNQVTISAEKDICSSSLNILLKTTLRKFVDDFFDQQEQEKGAENE